jgi:beta-lactamase class A
VERLAGARAEIESLVRAAPGRVGLVIKDLAGGETLGWSAEEQFPAASLIKLPVLLESLRQADLGRLVLEEPVAIRLRDKVGGAGILKELDSLRSLSLRDLLTLMIIVSDNTAANLCIDQVGMGAVNDYVASLGLRGTRLERKLMDLAAREIGRENLTTPADMALLLELLVTGQVLTPAGCDVALDILKRQQVNDRLPLLLPPEIPAAHKTGEQPGIRHDAGVLFLGSGAVVIAALTRDFAGPLEQGVAGGEASSLIARVSRVVFDVLTEARP